MSFLERFQLAQESPVIIFLSIFAALFIISALLYLRILLRKKGEKALVRQDFETFQSIRKRIEAKYDSFGRWQPGLFAIRMNRPKKTGESAKEGVVFYRQLLSSLFWQRLRLYHQNIEAEPVPGIGSFELFEDKGLGAIVQDWQVHGKAACPLDWHLMDHSLSDIEKESILLQLATALAYLHSMPPLEGRAVFHGLITPSEILIEQQQVNLHSVQLKTPGILWAFEEKKISGWLQHELCKKESQIRDFLAPEVLHGLSQASDYYSFGVLALYLFGGMDAVHKKQEGIEQLPKRWRQFVRRCIEEETKNRPKDFLELDDLLNDPELNQQLNEVDKMRQEVGNTELRPIANARDLFLKLRSKQEAEKKVDPKVEKGFQLLGNRQWSRAITHFEKLQKEAPSPRVDLGLAIGLHQKGERERARSLYEQIQSENPDLSAEFHAFLAKGH